MDEKKSQINIRLTTSEIELLKKKAKEHGMSVTEYIKICTGISVAPDTSVSDKGKCLYAKAISKEELLATIKECSDNNNDLNSCLEKIFLLKSKDA